VTSRAASEPKWSGPAWNKGQTWLRVTVYLTDGRYLMCCLQRVRGLTAKALQRNAGVEGEQWAKITSRYDLHGLAVRRTKDVKSENVSFRHMFPRAMGDY
jgi:hypothetical protein